MSGAGDPGDDDVARVVGKVVAGERVDELAVAAQMCVRDGDDLTLARGRRRGLRTREERRPVGGEQRRCDEDERIVARARQLDEGEKGDVHAATVPGAADAPLTPP